MRISDWSSDVCSSDLATIVTGADGAHLVLNARSGGSAGAITVGASGGSGGLNALTYVAGGPGNGLTELDPAQDAQVSIDAIAVGSSDHSISGAIRGVTLDFVSAKPGTRIAVTWSVTPAAPASPTRASESTSTAPAATSF